MAQDTIINRWDINGDVYEIQDAGRGRPLGVATLDENGRVPYTQLPESAVEFKGYWNADTNTPHLQDGTGTKGDLYYVDVAGTQDLGSGAQEFYVGDRVLYDGSVWKNISGDILEKAQQLFDVVHPIGEIYVQYPQQKSPTDLYNNNGITSTWTLQTQYAGAFFRSSGGNASTFIDENATLTKQEQATAKNGLKLRSDNGASSGTENVTASGGIDHSHNMTHYHNRGTLRIQGTAGHIVTEHNNTTYGSGALRFVTPSGQNSIGNSGSHYWGYGDIKIDTNNSSSWSGLTSSTVNSSGTAITNTGSASAYKHQHNIYLFGDTETRPDNFTIQIWKRTA